MEMSESTGRGPIPSPRRGATRRAAAAAAVGLAGLAGAAGLLGCGVGSGARGDQAPAAKAPRAVTLQWWSNFTATFKSQLDAALGRFRQQYPQLTVDLQIVAGAEYYPKLQTAAAAGAMPSVLDMESRAA